MADKKRYFRFGKYHPEEISVNWFEIRLTENEDIGYDMETYHIDLIDAIISNIKDYENRDLFEDGVSVFKTDENGLPVLENARQLKSFIGRVDEEAYDLFGVCVGTGADGEPLIRNIEAQPSNLTKNVFLDIINKTLEKNYKTVTISEDNKGAVYVGKDEVVWGGKIYTDPISSWDNRTGFIHKTTGKVKLVGGYKTKHIPLKDLATNVSHFISKAGNPMIRYTYNDKEYVQSEYAFNNHIVEITEYIKPKIVRAENI